MNTLSVCIIAWDEEPRLRTCLESLRKPDGAFIWDQLVIVIDDRTKDGTMAIADEYGAHVIWRRWDDDYGAARTFAEEHAMGDYILWIDADEKLIGGHQRILDLVAAGEVESVRPIFREDGQNPRQSVRQDLLHRRNSHKWLGKVHEWTEGPLGKVERGIVYEQIPRDVDRPHGPNGDIFPLLRQNLAEDFSERHMFYLCREHINAGHYQECIAIADLLIQQPPERTADGLLVPIQRSHAAILKGLAYEALNRPQLARHAYLQAIEEWSQWAEPWVAMGNMLMRLEVWHEAAAFFRAACEFPPVEYGFCDPSVYTWLRYENLSAALAKLGKIGEARQYLDIAMLGKPGDERMEANSRLLDEALFHAQCDHEAAARDNLIGEMNARAEVFRA